VRPCLGQPLDAADLYGRIAVGAKVVACVDRNGYTTSAVHALVELVRAGHDVEVRSYSEDLKLATWLVRDLETMS
jgi:hypothetical protein